MITLATLPGLGSASDTVYCATPLRPLRAIRFPGHARVAVEHRVIALKTPVRTPVTVQVLLVSGSVEPYAARRFPVSAAGIMIVSDSGGYLVKDLSEGVYDVSVRMVDAEVVLYFRRTGSLR